MHIMKCMMADDDGMSWVTIQIQSKSKHITQLIRCKENHILEKGNLWPDYNG